jgi:hypothetical protein
MAFVVHSKWLERQLDGTATSDLDSAIGGSTINLGIVTESVINVDTVDLFSSLTAVGTATGWTGPVTLASITFGVSGGIHTFDAADISQVAQDASGFTNGRSVIIYDSATSFILASSIEASVFGNVSGPLDITFDAAGIFRISRA